MDLRITGSKNQLISAYQAILHYKKKIFRHSKDDNPSVLIHCMDKLFMLPITIQDFKESNIIEMLSLIKMSWCKQPTNENENVKTALTKLIEKWLKDFEKGDTTNSKVLLSLQKLRNINSTEANESSMMNNGTEINIRADENSNLVTSKCKRKYRITSPEPVDAMQYSKVSPQFDAMNSTDKETSSAFMDKQIENSETKMINEKKCENDKTCQKYVDSSAKVEENGMDCFELVNSCMNQNIQSLNMEEKIPVYISNRKKPSSAFTNKQIENSETKMINEKKCENDKTFQKYVDSSPKVEQNSMDCFELVNSCTNQNIKYLNMEEKIPVYISNRSQKGCSKTTANPSANEYETDQNVITRREKQIEYGKNTQAYQRYIAQVPKNERSTGMPITPCKNLTYSRRQFDGLIKHWKLRVHAWDKSENGMIADEKEDKQSEL